MVTVHAVPESRWQSPAADPWSAPSSVLNNHTKGTTGNETRRHKRDDNTVPIIIPGGCGATRAMNIIDHSPSLKTSLIPLYFPGGADGGKGGGREGGREERGRGGMTMALLRPDLTDLSADGI